MPKKSDTLIICEDPKFSGTGRQRVLLNLTLRTATFENCHWPRKFLTGGYESVRVCRFEDIHAAHDFLSGKHRGTFLRIVLMLGHLIHIPVNANQLGSIFISTAYGRCRVFTDWNGFNEFRDAVHHICKQSPGRNWADDPRFIPLYALVIFSIVAGLIWCLL